MAARKRNSGMPSSSYVDGNTVRKLSPAPQQAEPVRKVREQERRSRRTRRNRDRALYMDGPYVFCLTVAAIATLFLCMNYLRVQSSITTRVHNIESLELQLENLKSENDALQTRIETSVDLEHVYKVATEELGMVYANKDQILLYDKTESEYVRQYEDIPQH